MARSLVFDSRWQLEREASGDAALFFLTFTAAGADPVRIVGDAADYVRDGATWHRAWFEIALLSEAEDRPPETEIRFPNVDRVLIAQLTTVTVPVICRVEVIHASQFDLTVEPRVALGPITPLYDARALRLRSVTADDVAVSGSLTGIDLGAFPALVRRASRPVFPGVYVR